MRRLPRTNSSFGQQAKHADVLKLQEIMTCGKLYSNNETNSEVYLVTFPTWRTTRRCRAAEVVAGTASVEVAAGADQRCRAAEVVAGAASAKVAAGAGQETSPAEVAAGAPSVEVAADAYPAEKSRP